MSCFPCFQNKDEAVVEEKSDVPIAQPTTFTPPPATPPVNNSNQNPLDDVRNAAEVEDNTVKSFTFREIATTTKNFRHEFLLGEGGYGKLFKGTLAATGQAVAVRQLERNTQGNNFVFEISTLSLIRHPNLVKMVGYCADGEQRFLVYEYFPSGSLKNFLFEPPEGEKPLDWTQRMKIAVGVAEALEYLHEKADPTIIYRDLRSSNILLTEAKVPKLSDYGLAKLVQGGNKMHMSVMTGFNGYCAPEFENNGDVTVKSDVYSFGVVLLELITGRKALDTSLPADEQSLVSWAQPLFKDPSKYPDMADPRLKKGFPVTGLNQAVGIAAMCLQEEPIARPLISDISAAISFLAMAPPVMPVHDPEPIPASQDDKAGHKEGETSSSSEEEEAEEEDDVRNHNHNRNQDEQPDYSLEEFIKYSSDEEEAHNESNADNKKSMKMQSRTDSRRNNKKSMKIKSRTDSRNATATNKTQTPLDSSSSSADEPPPPPPPIQPPHDEQDQDESSSSDEENWDGREGASSPKDHDALLPHSSSVESEDEAT